LLGGGDSSRRGVAGRGRRRARDSDREALATWKAKGGLGPSAMPRLPYTGEGVRMSAACTSGFAIVASTSATSTLLGVPQVGSVGEHEIVPASARNEVTSYRNVFGGESVACFATGTKPPPSENLYVVENAQTGARPPAPPVPGPPALPPPPPALAPPTPAPPLTPALPPPPPPPLPAPPLPPLPPPPAPPCAVAPLGLRWRRRRPHRGARRSRRRPRVMNRQSRTRRPRPSRGKARANSVDQVRTRSFHRGPLERDVITTS
jgi:hypothetical protein